MTLDDAGSLIFGIVVGYITYRTLARTTDKAAVSDLSAVIAAIGGGAVVKLYSPNSHLFAWYAIGIAGGMIIFFIVFWAMNGKDDAAHVMLAKPSADARPAPQ